MVRASATVISMRDKDAAPGDSKSGRPRKARLPAAEREKRQETARELFRRNPRMTIEEAQDRTHKLFGAPMGRSELSAIKNAYKAAHGLVPPAPQVHTGWQSPTILPIATRQMLVDVEGVKQRLRELLVKGKSPQYNGPLAVAGRQLVAIDSPAYDHEFALELAQAPPWFLIGKRAVLLEIARRGEARPSKKSGDAHIKALGQQLSAYTTRSSTSYDPDFDREIRTLRPDWFKRNGGEDGY